MSRLAAAPSLAPSAPGGAAEPWVLRLQGVGKEYRLYDSPRQRLKTLVTGRGLHRSKWALRDVDLELPRGHCLGVVGSNGAGKSTLLKLITGTLQPTCGSIQRRGRVTAILELGAGFHPEFTGRQNLYFGGSLIGIEHDHMAAIESQVLAFAEIGEAIDRPVRTYSSGMMMRLAFALVTAVEPDILIVDEALAVGDQYFQKKCIDRIRVFRDNGCTILFCSHSAYHVRHLCDMALWLDNGQVLRSGATEPVLLAYESHTRAALAAESIDDDPAAGSVHGVAADAARPDRAEGDAARITAVDVLHLEPTAVDDAAPLLEGRDLELIIDVQGQGDEQPQICFMIEQWRGVGITSILSHEENALPTASRGGAWRWRLSFPDLPLHSGEYVISVYLFDHSGLIVYDQWYQFQRFRFVTDTKAHGLVRLPHVWS